MVSEGVDIFITIFQKVGQQRLFPRTIMTRELGRQKRVFNKDQILYWFERSKYTDCRINAYPAFLSKAEEHDYENGINLNFFTPNILFIDLDQQNFGSREMLDTLLKRILKNIAKVLYDIRPLILWSGNGYHIIIPVSAPEALEQYKDFQAYARQPSDEFLRFAKDYLSLGKADNQNNPAFKSCLLRVPYTFNSKYLYDKADPEVKIIHPFSDTLSLPNIDNLLIEFQTYLADKKLNLDFQRRNKSKQNQINMECNTIECNTICYVEKLLSIGIADHRKFAISLILAPYFVNVQHLKENDSFDKIKVWILKCNRANEVRPSIRQFDNIIRYAISRCQNNPGIKPLRFEETLRQKNIELYQLLR